MITFRQNTQFLKLLALYQEFGSIEGRKNHITAELSLPTFSIPEIKEEQEKMTKRHFDN